MNDIVKGAKIQISLNRNILIKIKKVIKKFPPFVSSFATSAEDALNFKFSPPHFEHQERYYLRDKLSWDTSPSIPSAYIRHTYDLFFQFMPNVNRVYGRYLCTIAFQNTIFHTCLFFCSYNPFYLYGKFKRFQIEIFGNAKLQKCTFFKFEIEMI